MAAQGSWRFCAKCSGMYFDGYPDNKGTCPAGAGHVAAGFDFTLPYDEPESATAQGAWKFCGKCSTMFFDGYPDNKGTCPAGAGHAAAGYNFVLPHDVGETASSQGAWRFCGTCSGLFFDGYPDNKGTCPAGAGHAAAGYVFVLPHVGVPPAPPPPPPPPPPESGVQGSWRFCQGCSTMFFDGYPDNKGTCPGGGGHSAAGYEFLLPHDGPESATAQGAWKFCGRCSTMFYDGYPDNKGTCPAGAAHQAAGYNFVLPHDVGETSAAQGAWRFCGKCSSMFFDGYPEKGSCSAGGGHEAAGYNFVLPHVDVQPLNPTAPSFERMYAQGSWRFCQQCSGMFYDGYLDKGRCPAGTGHVGVGYEFALPRTLPPTAAMQDGWRYCGKCHGMFYDGYPEKGTCPAGQGHSAIGDMFVLPHDVPETPKAQSWWRYCGTCGGLFFDGYPDNKGTCPGGAGHEAAGYTFTLPHDITEPFVFNGRIVTGGLAALGGHFAVTINLDGSVRWNGHAHNSGIDGYDFAQSAVVRSIGGKAIALLRTGSVGGSIAPGEVDYDWDETDPPDPVLAEHLAEFALTDFQTNLQYESDIGSALESATSWLLTWAVGSMISPVGAAAIFVGVEVGSLAATGSLVPGARMINGVLWMAGPYNTLFAILGEGIASLGSRTRDVTQEEYDWANHEVFEGSLPPRDKLVLTDTLGPGGKAFAFPRWDGKIMIAMGEFIDDPRAWKVATGGKKYGQTFIHELVHACQIHHNEVRAAIAADALAARVCEAGGSDPYAYGSAPLDFVSLGLEAQAALVDDWFAGTDSRGATNMTKVPKDTNSPFFHYIVNNVRVGVF